jgi:hypothetical protein
MQRAQLSSSMLKPVCVCFAEHIGTKTAVQIRSHAQKFFTKLEKKKESGQQPDKGRANCGVPTAVDCTFAAIRLLGSTVATSPVLGTVHGSGSCLLSQQ